MKINYLLVFGVLIPIIAYSLAPNPLTGTLVDMPGFVLLYWYVRNKMDEKSAEEWGQGYVARRENMSDDEKKTEDLGALNTKVVCRQCHTAGFIRLQEQKDMNGKPNGKVYGHYCENCKMMYDLDDPSKVRQL